MVNITGGGTASILSNTNVSCNGGSNANATATMTGGTPNYTFAWSNGQTTSTATGLSFGTYTVTVTDANGCSSVTTVSISQPTALSSVPSQTNVTCNGGTGSACVTPGGGTPAYTYAWSPSGGNSSCATGLSAGNYTVTVTDANGCTSFSAFTITQPTAVTAVPSSANVSCNGGTNGSASVTAGGGAGGYSYLWSSSQTTSSVTGLSAGNYTITVTDANGCTRTTPFTITQPTVLTASTSIVNNASCFGTSNGSAIANGAGGTAPYGYSWNSAPVQNTQTANNLPAGTYSVIVTDANGCTTPSSATITQPVAITLSSTTAMASCGQSNGTATVTATGGTGTYSYLWLGVNPAQTTQTLNNVPGGTYNAVVTDANGCNSILSVTVPGGAPPTALFTNNPDVVSLLEATIAFFDLSINAATWYWDFGDPLNPTTSTQQNPNHTYSDTGTYCITLVVTDPGGVCMDTTVHCIKVIAPFTFYVPNAFTPNGDIYNQFFFGEGTYIKEFRMWIYDRWGNEIWNCHTFGEPQLSPDCMWDGKVRRGGEIVQEDVYVWMVELRDANNIEHKYIGHVSVIK